MMSHLNPASYGQHDPWMTQGYPDIQADSNQPSTSQQSGSNSKRGTKRRKDSGQVDVEGLRRNQGGSSGILPGHIGSDDYRNAMMIGPGAGVNPEDIHPQLDFTAFDHDTVSEYLERNNAIPKFGYGSIHSIWDVNARATDPRLLYIDEPEPIQTMLPGPPMMGNNMLPGTVQPNRNGARESGPNQASPRDREGRATKRRSTATSMVAAAIEESITMAEEEERKRKEKGKNEEGNAGLDAGDRAATTGAGEEGPTASQQEDDTGDMKEEDGSGDATSPPALRRSGRKPLPPGTSLAITYRNTRSSPSPTPSFNSEDDVDPFVPILADIDLAKKVFAERASRHWRDALAAGGGATVQGPGVNPAFAGQVMMGGTGGMMREGEVVAEFLYATRVKSKALKVAAHTPSIEGNTNGDPNGIYRSRVG